MEPTTLALISGGAAVASPFIGNLVGKSMYPGMTSSTPMNLAYLSALAAGQTPVPELQDINFAQYATPEEIKYIGDLQAAQQQQSGLTGVDISPEFAAAQRQALTGMQDVVSQRGLTEADRAVLSQIAAEEANRERAGREAILQGAQARGLGGSGLELAAQLQAQQDAATRSSARNAQVAQDAQQRYLQALAQTGQMGSEFGQQEFARGAARGQAQDVINQFNVANTNTAMAENRAMQQQLAAQNVANRNAINQANIDLRNQATQYNVAQKPMAQFGMASGQAQNVASALQGAAGLGQQQLGQKYGVMAGTTGGVLQGVGSAFGGYAQGYGQGYGRQAADRDFATKPAPGKV